MYFRLILLVTVYESDNSNSPPLHPPTILMDDEMAPEGSADDETSSPAEYNTESPEGDNNSIEDDLSSQSTQGEDANSDVEVDV